MYDVHAIDPDEDTLHYELLEGPEGAVIHAATGVLNWAPTEAGEYAFKVRVSDGRGGEDIQSWVVVVDSPNADNVAPVIQAVDPLQWTVDSGYRIAVDVSDADGDSLLYSLIQNPGLGIDCPEGMTIDRMTGVIDWTPNENQVGTYTIRVRVTDGRGGSDTKDISITVSRPTGTDTNGKPVVTSTPPLVTPAEKVYIYQVVAGDPDGHALQYKLVYSPEGMAIDSATGLIVWKPTDGQIGESYIVVEVNDGHGGITYHDFSLRVVASNSAPQITSMPGGIISLGNNWTYQVMAEDPDQDTLTYSLDAASLANGIAIDAATGLLTWTPAVAGVYDIVVKVEDGRGGYAMQGFSVEIPETVYHAPPAITSTPKGPAFVGEEWSYVLETDQPAGSYTLVLDADSIGRGMSLTGDVLTWTPNGIGDAPVKITLTDQYGGTCTQTFTISARPQPVLILPPEITSEPMGPAYVGEDWSYQITATDPGQYGLTYYQVMEDDSLRMLDNGLLVLNAANVGAQKITIRVVNEHDAWTEQVFTLTFVNRPVQNDPPVITSVPTGPAMVDEAYRYQVKAHDPEGDTLTYTVDVASQEAGISIGENGLLTWTPSEAGTQTVIVTVTDTHGNAAIQEFELGVEPQPIISQPPVITSQPTGPAYVGEEWSYTIGAHDPDQDAITFWHVDENGNKVSQIDSSTRMVTWTPTETGERTFRIRVEDTHGFWIEQSFTMIAVEAPVQNDPPVITSVPTGPAFVGDRYEYRVAAFDPNGDAISYQLDDDSIQRGVMIGSDGRMTWMPTEAGEWRIEITVTDDKGAATTQGFVLPVVARPVLNEAPTIYSTPVGPAYVGEDWSYQILATDPENDTLTYTLVDTDGNLLKILSGGLLTWSATAEGSRTFIVRATDSEGNWAQQTFTIPATTRPVQVDPPSISSAPTGPAFQGEEYVYQVDAATQDGSSPVYTLDQASIDHGLVIDENGRLSWTPETTGSYEISVTVADQSGGYAVQTFTLDVVARAVEKVPPTITSQPKGPAYVDIDWTYTVQAVNEEGTADGITYWLMSEGGEKIAQIDPLDNTVRWTPTEVGTRTFIIRAEGPDGEYAEQRFSIDVVAVPVQIQAPVFTSVPTNPTYVDERYEYRVTAKTFDGTAPTFSLDPASYDLGIRINGSGLLSWIPATAGEFTIAITVADGSGNETVQTFILTTMDRPVVLVPPTITSEPVGPAYVNQPWTYQLSGHATDSGAVTFLLVTSDGETIRELDNGLLAMTWDTTGSQSLIVRAVDSRGAWIEQRFTIPVIEEIVVTNDAPVIRSMPVEQMLLGGTYQYKVTAFDPNGDAIQYRLGDGSPAGASISSDGLLTWTPTMLGTYEFTIIVSDGELESSQTFSLNVQAPVVANTPPEITSIPVGHPMKDKEYRYQATAVDVDGDTLTWTLDASQIPETMRSDISFDTATGLLVWTPRAAGQYTLTIFVSDGQESDGQTIVFTVAENAPPVIAGLSDLNAQVGSPYTAQVHADDPNGDALVYGLENAPAGLEINTNDGTLIWTTPVVGRYTITVTVSDGEETARRQFQIQVTDPDAVNLEPSIVGTLPGSIPTGVPFTYQLGATDPENDPVTFKLLDGPDGMVISSGGRIEWTPTATGEATFEVRISDGTNAVVYTYSLTVVAQRQNNAPIFTSQPPVSVPANKTFTYKPTATDPDGDSVIITLVDGPPGMQIDSSGNIVWNPTSSQAGKKFSMILRATDAYGLAVEETYELTVRSVILAPTVEMNPLPMGVVGVEMVYQIVASDPQGEKLTYHLVSYPTGTTWDSNTGVFRYTPMAEGIYEFKVQVVNKSGVATPVIVFPMMAVDLTPVDPGPGTPGFNNAPQLNLPESSYVEAGKPWSHQLTAIDPEGDPLTFELINPPSGVEIDAATGLITWTPTEAMIEHQFQIRVKVSDDKGAYQSGYFWLEVTPKNILPIVKTIPAQTVTAGGKFQYYVAATDENPTDTLTYSLDQASLDRGMTIDSKSGLISWSPGLERTGEAYDVTVFVTDGRDAPVDRTFRLTVTEDKTAPRVTITATPSKTAAGEKVTINVSAIDDVGVASVTLMLKTVEKNGQEPTVVNKVIQLVNGRAEYTLNANEFGILTFAATAIDVNGNESAPVLATVQATNPADTEAPFLAITSHSQGSKIYGPVDIVGTITDQGGYVNWTLKAVAMDNGKEVLISSGNQEIVNGVIGRFDTTMLRNGTWQIMLEAEDEGGNKSEKFFNVELEGEYKLGNFNMSFTDFDLMLSGLGITITRTYDTLNADVKGDFGYGWTLDIATTEISVVIGDGDSAQNGFSPYYGITDGTHITITLPDGTKEGFTFQARGEDYGITGQFAGIVPPAYYYPEWIPDPGTKSTLSGSDTPIYRNTDGTFTVGGATGGMSMYPYSPATDKNGFLTLTLRNGIDLVIDATNGQLHQAIDLNGNTLTFTKNSITHSSGKGVVFERDYDDRIIAITGPDGRKVTYEYDLLGNLVASTDQSGATTRFTYLTDVNDPEHYLDEVIDPLGRPAVKTVYDDHGRIKTQSDAAGKTIEYEWDSIGHTQKVTDQLGNTTILVNDDHGNVVKEISPEGAVTLRTYDLSGNMLIETRVIDHNGITYHLTTSYTYDSDGNILTEKDERGNLTQYEYNEYGQEISVIYSNCKRVQQDVINDVTHFAHSVIL